MFELSEGKKKKKYHRYRNKYYQIEFFLSESVSDLSFQLKHAVIFWSLFNLSMDV